MQLAENLKAADQWAAITKVFTGLTLGSFFFFWIQAFGYIPGNAIDIALPIIMLFVGLTSLSEGVQYALVGGLENLVGQRFVWGILYSFGTVSWFYGLVFHNDTFAMIGFFIMGMLGWNIFMTLAYMTPVGLFGFAALWELRHNRAN